MNNDKIEYNKEIIEKIKKSLIETYNPKYIYLFGSYAWGSPNNDSDMDFFVVVEESPLSMSSRMRLGYASLPDISIPLDLIVYTMKELNEKKEHPSSLNHKILHKGVMIYEAA